MLGRAPDRSGMRLARIRRLHHRPRRSPIPRSRRSPASNSWRGRPARSNKSALRRRDQDPAHRCEDRSVLARVGHARGVDRHGVCRPARGTLELPPDARGYIYQMNCIGGTVYEFLIVDAQGKIATHPLQGPARDRDDPGPRRAPPPQRRRRRRAPWLAGRGTIAGYSYDDPRAHRPASRPTTPRSRRSG